VPERRGGLRGAAQAWHEGGPLLLASRAARRAAEQLERGAEQLAVAGAARAVRRAGPPTLPEAIAFADAFDYGGVSIRPMQVESEIGAFLEAVSAEPPRTLLEIGTGRGGTLFLLARAADERAVLVSVDAPEGDAAFCGRPAYKRRERLYGALGRPDQRVVYISADSHDDATKTRVQQELNGAPLDLLFIDGDHTFEGVEADFRMYAPLVRSGGLVAFHDIVPGAPEAVGGVPAFWEEIRRPDSLQFVADWEQGCCGIGVLRV
jgi:predicted O-methyltransferase YrrM